MEFVFLPSVLPPDEEPGPHVEPVPQTDALHGDLVGPHRLLPGESLLDWGSLPLDLLEERLQEDAVVVDHRDVVDVLLLPASDTPEHLIDGLDILILLSVVPVNFALKIIIIIIIIINCTNVHKNIHIYILTWM